MTEVFDVSHGEGGPSWLLPLLDQQQQRLVSEPCIAICLRTFVLSVCHLGLSISSDFALISLRQLKKVRDILTKVRQENNSMRAGFYCAIDS